MSGAPASDAGEAILATARQLGDLEARLAAAPSAEVQLSLLERATELAESAARMLEQVARDTA
jgi:hypothetical protein